ncbi:MAG: alpha/beta fold hydrolase [Phycisphaerae bacterium]|nr:alpha/beta fold hydrolase [Phycisphaerae bacterium]
MSFLARFACLALMCWGGPLLAQSVHRGIAPGTGDGAEYSDQAASAGRVEPAKRSQTAASAPAKTGSPGALKRVTFTTEDEVLIVGDYAEPVLRGGQKLAPMAILLHMYQSDRSAFTPLIGPLRRAGFAVLAIDLRGHGESNAPARLQLVERVRQRDPDLFKSMHRDVAAAYLWLRDQPGVDPARFVLVGASVGCSVALDYAGRDKSVDAVACLTPGTAYLALDSMAHIEKCANRPILMIAAEGERAAADRLAQAAGQHVAVKVVPDQPALGEKGLHGTRMLDKVADIDKTMIEFLSRSVGPPSTHPVIATPRGRTYHEPNSSYARQAGRLNLRWFSSPAEAEARGLKAPKTSDEIGVSPDEPPKASASRRTEAKRSR